MSGKLCTIGIVCGLLAGCSNNGLTLGRVSGKVTYKGEPVRYGFVTFHPDAEKGAIGPPAMSPITDAGTYLLTTQEAGDGAVVGTHHVAIIALDPKPVAGADAPEPEEDPKAFMIAKGQAPKPKPKNLGGPTFTSRNGKLYRLLGSEKLKTPDTSGLTVQVQRGTNTLDFNIAEDGMADVAK